jgi:D-alanine--poly(phosphoribitol) ligase subunit 2
MRTSPLVRTWDAVHSSQALARGAVECAVADVRQTQVLENLAMPIAERVLEILEDIAETDEVRHDLDLRLYDEHLLDSLATVGLMAAFSQEFGIEMSPSEFERELWATPRMIVAFVENRVGQ